MNRKKALITLATIEGIINLTLIVLFVMGQMSLTAFLISFAAVTLLTMGLIFIINRKCSE